MNKRRGTSFSSGFVLGGLVGAVLVFLYGTEEGRKIKTILARKGKKWADDFPELVEDLEKKGEDFAQKINRVKKEFEEGAKDLSKIAKKEVESSLGHIEKTQERGRSLVKSIQKRFFTRKGRKLS